MQKQEGKTALYCRFSKDDGMSEVSRFPAFPFALIAALAFLDMSFAYCSLNQFRKYIRSSVLSFLKVSIFSSTEISCTLYCGRKYSTN